MSYSDQALAFILQHMPDATREELSFEQALAFDGEKAVVLGRGRESYERCSPEYTIAGTSDLIRRQPLLITIVDWKTGHGGKAYNQLLCLAGLAAYERDDWPPETQVRLMSVEVRPASFRVAIDVSKPITEAKSFLLTLHNTLLASTNEKIPGPHCHQLYCPHSKACFGLGD